MGLTTLLALFGSPREVAEAWVRTVRRYLYRMLVSVSYRARCCRQSVGVMKAGDEQ